MVAHKAPHAMVTALGLGLLFAVGLPAAEVTAKNSAELRQALREARPGAVILLAAGTYEGGLFVERVQGARGRPIIVAAADKQNPPVFKGSGQAFHLSDCAHLELRDLVAEKTSTNGINIDDGGSLDTPAHHITLKNIVVRDAGTTGNQDGIKLSGLDDFRIEDCTVERWGRGGSAIDMVGCHRGVIERCTFRDRESDGAANAVQTKGGTHTVTIRRCLFEHAGQRAVNIGGSTGLAYFRPSPQGYEAKDIVVEGCTFIGSEAPVAFVGVDGATVRFNTFYRPRAWFLRILQETRAPGFVPCRNGRFTDNLIVYRASEMRTAVNIGPDTAPETFAFARNFWYCADNPARSIPRLPVAEAEPRGGQYPMLKDPEKGDFTPKEGSPASKCGAGACPAP